MKEVNRGMYEIATVDVVKKHIGWTPLRITGLIIGVLFGILGAIPLAFLMFLGPVGVIFGFLILFPIMITSGAGFVMTMKFQKITCPNCGKNKTVWQRMNTDKCFHCKIPININWIEE